MGKRAGWWKRAVKKVTKFLRYRKMRLGPRDFKKLRKLRKQLIRRYRKIKKSNPRYARSWYKRGRRSAIKILLRKKLIRKVKRKIKKKGLMHVHKWYKHAKWSARKFIKRWKRAGWWKRAVKKVNKFLRYRKMRLGPRDFKKLRKLRKQLIRRYRKIKKSNPRYARSWYKRGRRSAIKFIKKKLKR